MIRHPGGPAVILASPPISRLAREIVPRKSRRSSRIDPSTSEPFSFGTRCLPAAALTIMRLDRNHDRSRPAGPGEIAARGTVTTWRFCAGK